MGHLGKGKDFFVMDHETCWITVYHSTIKRKLEQRTNRLDSLFIYFILLLLGLFRLKTLIL